MRPRLHCSLGRNFFLYGTHQDECQRFEGTRAVSFTYETVGASLRGRPLFRATRGAHGGTPLHKLGQARHSSELYLRV